MQDNILVVGSSGQIGSELVLELRKSYGEDHVIASDIVESSVEVMNFGQFEILDITDNEKLLRIVKKHNISQIYLLAAILSANAEKNINHAWDLNMKSLFNVLNLAKEKIIKKIFWPSSIAVFGPTTPKQLTPQYTVTEPNTVYGISKLAGERWCEYYFNKFNVDVRSIRYPGLIGWKSKPGGGTTDYAVEIFHQAIQDNTYTSFLSEKTTLPMMYMSDAIRATIEIMEAPFEKIKIPVFMGYYYKNKEEQDDTVRVEDMIDMFGQLGTVDNQKKKVAFPEAKSHVITSYLSTTVYDKVAQETLSFLKEQLPITKQDSLHLQ